MGIKTSKVTKTKRVTIKEALGTQETGQMYGYRAGTGDAWQNRTDKE